MCVVLDDDAHGAVQKRVRGFITDNLAGGDSGLRNGRCAATKIVPDVIRLKPIAIVNV